MEKYSKIETLFVRDESFVVTDELKNPVLAEIRRWIVTEKIDGTNIRVMLTADDELKFAGRSDKAQLPPRLLEYLQSTFTVEGLKSLRREGDEGVEICLYGEGYGAGIQKGSGYRSDNSFILFDVKIANEWFLADEAVTEIARKLGIDRVPILGIWDMDTIVATVKTGFSSHLPTENPVAAEGIVARPITPLYDHRKKRIIIKLKTKDYKPGKR